MNITQKTYKRNVQKFGIRNDKAFAKLMKFAKSMKMSGKKVDELCGIVDEFILNQSEIDEYCVKNDIDKNTFCCDIINCSGNGKVN